ncbi:MAG: hypothetical protein M3305_01110 [Actinomycetota bacterium]|nr:hypothetical protein [Actinomycetota bacterium]
MIRAMREDWRRFKASQPGYRFRDRYRHRRRSRRQASNLGRFDFQKVLFTISGIGIALGSIVLAPLPGPGMATLLLGLAIIAGELLIVAHSLDWAEVKLRVPARRAKSAWAKLPRWARTVISTVAWVGSIAIGLWAFLYGFWWPL